MKEVGRTSRGRFLFSGSILLFGLLGGGVWLASRLLRETPSSPPIPASESPDPRLAYAGPYRNVHPNVRYVGDDSCVDCHKDIARSYAAHPMGRSLVPVASVI